MKKAKLFTFLVLFAISFANFSALRPSTNSSMDSISGIDPGGGRPPR